MALNTIKENFVRMERKNSVLYTINSSSIYNLSKHKMNGCFFLNSQKLPILAVQVPYNINTIYLVKNPFSVPPYRETSIPFKATVVIPKPSKHKKHICTMISFKAQLEIFDLM